MGQVASVASHFAELRRFEKWKETRQLIETEYRVQCNTDDKKKRGIFVANMKIYRGRSCKHPFIHFVH